VRRAAKARAIGDTAVIRSLRPRTREERRRARARLQVLAGFVVVQLFLWVITDSLATRMGVGLLSLAVLPVVAHLVNPRSR